MHINEEEFKNILLESQILDRAEFEEIKEEAQRSGQNLINIILGRGSISEKFLTELLASFFRVETTDFKDIEERKEIVKMIPEEFAKKKRLVAFDWNSSKRLLKVAMRDPGDLETIKYLEHNLSCAVKPYIITLTDLERGLRQYEQKLEQKFSKIISENLEKARTLSGEIDLVKVARETPIIAILDAIIEHAISLKATDIHFEPLGDISLVRYRIDGILREMLTFPKIIYPFLVARVKVLANLAIDEHRKPQDGRFLFSFSFGNSDVRVSIIPIFFGERIEMRLLKPREKPWNLVDLGVNPLQQKIIEESIKITYGMLLATGPTGSGKTTTLYTILGLLNTPKVNIMTIEDPIEYSISRVNQVQVNPKAGIAFATGLRSIVRQDPDIIMIGEIRDSETAKIATHAALTGHLILSTLHTTDASGAIPRLINLEVEPYLIASTVKLIIAQRLVRKVCLNCIESYKPTEEIKKLINAQLTLGGVTKVLPKVLYKGKGCKQCGYTGYSDRIGIFECFKVSEEMKKLILKKASSFEIRNQAIREGMTTLFQNGLEKVEAGITTIDEILRVIRE